MNSLHSRVTPVIAYGMTSPYSNHKFGGDLFTFVSPNAPLLFLLGAASGSKLSLTPDRHLPTDTRPLTYRYQANNSGTIEMRNPF